MTIATPTMLTKIAVSVVWAVTKRPSAALTRPWHLTHAMQRSGTPKRLQRIISARDGRSCQRREAM